MKSINGHKDFIDVGCSFICKNYIKKLSFLKIKQFLRKNNRLALSKQALLEYIYLYGKKFTKLFPPTNKSIFLMVIMK